MQCNDSDPGGSPITRISNRKVSSFKHGACWLEQYVWSVSRETFGSLRISVAIANSQGDLKKYMQELIDVQSQSDNSSSAKVPAISPLMPSTPLYGGGSFPHLPKSQSTRQRPDPVAEASSGVFASPFPSFHTTRWTPTSGGHAPVPTGMILF